MKTRTLPARPHFASFIFSMKKKTRVSSKTKKYFLRYPVKSADTPATCGMLYELRYELKSDMKSLQADLHGFRAEMNGKFEGINGKLAGIDGRFDAIDGKFAEIDGRFEALDGKFKAVDKQFESLSAEMRSHFHNMKLLIEEQNARNKYVLDGYTQIFDRQNKLDSRVSSLEKK
ncbi:MAG: hypothetical protein AB7F59_06020 [Bdellovibrionales bacterium]